MRKFHGIALIAMAIAVCTASNAQSAAVNQPMRGGTCFGTPQLLTCDYLGKVTIKEIFDRGWRVVSLVKEGPNSVTLIIEEQR